MLQALFNKVRNIYKEKSDQELLDTEEKRVADLEQIQALTASPQGQILIKWLINEIETIFYKLLETREDKLISDLKAYTNLLKKLSANHDIDYIQKWLEEKLKD